MPTYGIMHDDGTFEPLNQQQQIPQQNWRYRPANVYGNRVVAGMQHQGAPRYSGNGYAPRTVGYGVESMYGAAPAYPLQNNIYYGPGAPVAQRWYGSNPNVSTVYGGYGYNAPQNQAVQTVGGRQPVNITQTAKRALNLPSGVYWDAQRQVYTNVPSTNVQGTRVRNQPQPLPVGVSSAAPMVYNQPQQYVPYQYNPGINYFSDWGTGEVPYYNAALNGPNALAQQTALSAQVAGNPYYYNAVRGNDPIRNAFDVIKSYFRNNDGVSKTISELETQANLIPSVPSSSVAEVGTITTTSKKPASKVDNAVDKLVNSELVNTDETLEEYQRRLGLTAQ